MYNSLQFSLNRRFAGGLQVRRGLHLSARVMDDGSNQRDIIPDTYDAITSGGRRTSIPGTC